MDRVVETVCQIFKDKIEDQSVCIGPESRMESLSISSVVYISILVSIESTYGIEFDDDYLVKERFDSIQELCDYVSEKREALNH